MALPDRSIFRQRAIDSYMQGQEAHAILRLVSPRVARFFWILFLLLLAACVLVWSIQVPITVQGKGAIIPMSSSSSISGQGIVVLLLFSTSEQSKLKTGQAVSVTVGDTTFQSTIQTVEPQVMSVLAILHLTNKPLPPGVVSGPAAVATALVQPASQAQSYLGSMCQAQVTVGARSALSLI